MRVDLPVPEGPEKTMGRALAVGEEGSMGGILAVVEESCCTFGEARYTGRQYLLIGASRYAKTLMCLN